MERFVALRSNIGAIGCGSGAIMREPGQARSHLKKFAAISGMAGAAAAAARVHLDGRWRLEGGGI